MKGTYLGAVLFLTVLWGQSPYRNALFHKKPEKVIPGEALELSVVYRQPIDVLQGEIYYREPGTLSYFVLEMNFTGTGWTRQIPGNRITEAGLEYFIILHLGNGGIVSYPDRSPRDNPFYLPADLTQGRRRSRAQVKPKPEVQEEVLILSPEPGSYQPAQEVVVAVSLFSAGDVDTTRIRLLLDGVEVSGVEYSQSVVTKILPALAPGTHTLSLRMVTLHGLPIAPTDWTFSVAESGPTIREQMNLKGKVGSRLSWEQTAGQSKTIGEITGQASSGITWMDTKASFRLTSRENPFQQPYNRFSWTTVFGQYLSIDLGDYHPSVSPYMIDGKRVRGIGVYITFPWFEFRSVSGTLRRAVQEKDETDGGYLLQTANIKTDSSGIYTYPLDRTGYTFERAINLYEISIRTPEKFRWKLAALKAKDDLESVNKTLRSSSQFTVDSTATGLRPGTYTYGQFATMVQDSGGRISFPNDHWGGGDPADNLVVGTTLEGILDDQRLNLEFSWNFSLYNRNIWDGAVSRTQMDTTLDDSLDGFIGVNYDENGLATEGSLFIDTAKVFDPLLYEGLFTINAYMTPLIPFDMTEFGKHPIATVVNLPSAAFHLKMIGNYGWQTFNVEYRQVGPEFVSLANPFLTTNIREFVAAERLALMEHKLNLSLTYKFHDNKILSTTVDPLVTHTLTFGLGVTPGPDVPSMMVNVQTIGKTNEKKELDIIGDSRQDLREDFKTVNSLFSVNYPFEIAGKKQIASVNYATVLNHDLLKNDRGPNYVFNKTNSDAFSFNLSTRIDESWRMIANVSRTNLYLPMMNSAGVIVQKPYTWTALNLTTQNTFQDARFRTVGSLMFLHSTGDVKSNIYGLKFGGEYDVVANLVASVNGNFQLAHYPGYRKDNVDNNNNGKVDEWLEPWSVSTAGFFANLTYSF